MKIKIKNSTIPLLPKCLLAVQKRRTLPHLVPYHHTEHTCFLNTSQNEKSIKYNIYINLVQNKKK